MASNLAGDGLQPKSNGLQPDPEKMRQCVPQSSFMLSSAVRWSIVVREGRKPVLGFFVAPQPAFPNQTFCEPAILCGPAGAIISLDILIVNPK